MAIQSRRGAYADFDPSKLLPGEWAAVLSGDENSEDGMSIYLCFSAGKVKRMATYDDMLQNIVSATSDIQAQFTAELQQKIQDAANATEAAETAASEAESAKQDADAAATRANDAAERLEDTDVSALVSRIEALEEAIVKCIGTA